MKCIIFTLVLMLTAAVGNAADTTVNSFYKGTELLSMLEDCKIDGVSATIDCVRGSGYVNGIVDAHDAFVGRNEMAQLFCLPKVTQNQLRLVVIKYFNEVPEQLHLAGGALALIALEEAFPCEE